MAKEPPWWEAFSVIRVHVFCEGQTEETFVRDLLSQHFDEINIFLNPIVVRTSKYGKGGISTYGKIKSQIEKKCKEDPSAWVTTLLDFYGLPSDFPGLQENQRMSSIDRAQAVMKSFQSDIEQENFIAHLVIHEFEGLLFSSPEAFGAWFDDKKVVNQLTKVREEFDSPEHINDGVATAPSKRIIKICDNYDKVLHGTLISLAIGLEAIRSRCSLFNQWIERIESLQDDQ